MRDQRIDIVKGLAIILMVIAHAGCEKNIADLINNFHMPVFFITAGWLYKIDNDSFCSAWGYMQKRLKRLWVPYVIWGSLCVLLWNVCFDINVYSESPLVRNRWVFSTFDYSELPKRLFGVLLMREGCSGLTGTFWFLRSMLFAACGYRLVDFMLAKFGIRSLVGQSVITLVALICCGVPSLMRYVAFSTQWAGGAATVLGYIFIHIGVLLRYKRIDFGYASGKVISCVALICFSGLLCMLPFERLRFGAARFDNILLVLTCAVSGWYLLLAISSILPYKHILAYIGVHSMTIMIFHFLAFKVVSLLGILYKGDDLVLVASFPVFYKGTGWCICYTIAGIILPLTADLLWRRTYDLVKRSLCYA